MPKPQTPSPALRKPPKPSLAAVDAFVGGNEPSAKKQTEAPVPEAPTPETPTTKVAKKKKANLRHPEPPTQVKHKRLTVDVPIDHWWALKTKSMHEGRSLQDILSEAVASLVEG